MKTIFHYYCGKKDFWISTIFIYYLFLQSLSIIFFCIHSLFSLIVMLSAYKNKKHRQKMNQSQNKTIAAYKFKFQIRGIIFSASGSSRFLKCFHRTYREQQMKAFVVKNYLKKLWKFSDKTEKMFCVSKSDSTSEVMEFVHISYFQISSRCIIVKR